MSVTQEEYTLAHRAKTEDAAFTLLYERYFPKIYAYVFRRIGQVQTTEDIVSATFEKVFLHLDQFKPGSGTFQAWVYRIATNQVIDHIRKHKRVILVAPEDFPEPLHSAQDDVEEIIKKQDAEAIRTGIQQLPERYQKVITLKYFSQLSTLELAEILNISPNNVGVLVCRALKKLQHVLPKL